MRFLMSWIRELLEGVGNSGWPPAIAPHSSSPVRVWYMGASFSNVPTSHRADGPRTAEWLSMIWSYYGNIVCPDGEPGDMLENFEGYATKNIDRDTLNNELSELQDAAVLEFFGDAFGESSTGDSVAINRAVAHLTRMGTRARKTYFIQYPPLEPAYGTSLLVSAPELTVETWNAWRNRYKAAMELAGHTEIVAYYDWVPTLRPIANPPGTLDYHAKSISCYDAANRISQAVLAGVA